MPSGGQTNGPSTCMGCGFMPNSEYCRTCRSRALARSNYSKKPCTKRVFIATCGDEMRQRLAKKKAEEEEDLATSGRRRRRPAARAASAAMSQQTAELSSQDYETAFDRESEAAPRQVFARAASNRPRLHATPSLMALATLRSGL
jgi:hypothetical protein